LTLMVIAIQYKTAMKWEPMSIDEFAEHQRASGMKVRKLGGVWWAEVRPFFFRPVFPFTALDPEAVRYPYSSWIGGVLHAVGPGVVPNSRMNLFVYDDLKNYSLSVLGDKHRNITRKGIKNFTARRITDSAEFIRDAYEVYLSFYERTRYRYKSERLIKSNFVSWAQALFSSSKVFVLGAYRNNRLAAVDISYHVENIIYDDVFFSDSESLSFKVTDFMLHTLREYAAASGAQYLYRGLPTGKPSLDASKLTRGVRVLELPACCRLNPFALFAVRLIMKESYNKLMGLTGTTQSSLNAGFASGSLP